MIRVLHSVSYMHRAGVETFLMNYFRNIDRSRVQFDFLCNKELPGDYDDEIKRLGGRIFYRPDGLKEQEYVSFWSTFLTQHPEIKIVHTHNGAKQIFPLQGAKNAGLAVRIAHAHSTDFVHDVKYQRRLELIHQLPDAASHYYGCSNMAGQFFFGSVLWEREGVLIRNAIPCVQFALNPSVREQLRKELGVSDCFVIGHVGRFQKQKNHSRLLHIFYEVYQKNHQARLLLIGSGDLVPSVQKDAEQLGLCDVVIFTGECADISRWYQAMDVFVMPSLFEGLTLCGIEAQAAGLPCVFSDVVSQETQLTDPVCFISLGKSNQEWCDKILSFVSYSRMNTCDCIAAAGYDIRVEAIRLMKLYITLVGGEAEE